MTSVAIIPAFNEEFTIASVCFLTGKYVDKVIVVDDGSNDKTSELAGIAGAKVYRFSHNQGKAAAVMKGLQEAISINPDVIVMIDADGQHNPAQIPLLIEPVLNGDADFVIGSRFLENTNNVPKFRRVGQVLLDHTICSKQKLTDTQSGFRSFGKASYNHLLMISSYGYNIELDMIEYLQKQNLKIMEVPIQVRYKNLPNAHKKNPIIHGFDVATFAFGFIGYKRPLLLFGIPGIISLIIGVILGFMGFNIYDTTKLFPISYAMMSVLLIISGLLLLITALIINAFDVIIKKQLH